MVRIEASSPCELAARGWEGTMDAYVYQAELYCEGCAAELMERLPKPTGYPDAFDSNEYPAGPYADGGGEADGPQHCAKCGEFLENPLTDDGIRYVLKELVQFVAYECECDTPLAEWARFYYDELLSAAE